ncbi:MAG: peptidase glycoprotease [Polaromonas sp.]|nr:peptidase glycoprotease [Polaromonas sp.]
MLDNTKFLAFDTSTDRMSVAVTDGERIWQHSGPGGARASSTLIPAIMALLAEAGLGLGDLRALVFGRGPGSFTGLRTACAVAQGLALGAQRGSGIAVLPVDTLMAVAEEARFQQQISATGADAAGASQALEVTALLDARMDEMYCQSFAFDGRRWSSREACRLISPQALDVTLADGRHVHLVAGNVFEVYAGRLPALAGMNCIEAYPTATALLRLAPVLAADGCCVDAALALPLYVRDKVALTTEERAIVRQGKADAELLASGAAPR